MPSVRAVDHNLVCFGAFGVLIIAVLLQHSTLYTQTEVAKAKN